MNIAINGFGRIGKNFFRALIEDESIKDKIKITVINVGPADPEDLPYSIKYDTILPTYKKEVYYKDDYLYYDNRKVAIIAKSDPLDIDWAKYDIDWVVDCSGQFTSRKGAQKHLKSGAKAVLISAPAKNPDVTIIPGINYQDYNKEDRIVSLGSCTTNALVPMLYVIEKNFGIKHAAMTTAHAYTNSQALLDNTPKDEKIRRSRAAALNIVPTTTGSMEVADKILTSLKDKLIGKAIRVPVGIVSVVDLVCVTKVEVNAEEVNQAFEQAAQGELKDIMKVSYEPLVSSDYMQDPHTPVVDGLLTQTVGCLVKSWGWYDNEWGYAIRMKDFLLYSLSK